MIGHQTIVAVLGVSGVGKTRLISELVERLPESCTFRASDIIGEARQNKDPEYLRTLPSDEILQSQELLVRGFTARMGSARHRLVLLDAHSVIDSDAGYVDMPQEVFRRLCASAFVHIEDEPKAIVARRSSDPLKKRPIRTVDPGVSISDSIAHSLQRNRSKAVEGYLPGYFW